MKNSRNLIMLFLISSLLIGSLPTVGWAQDDSLQERQNLMDLFVARPLGVAAGIMGTGFFILSLPFTVPTMSTDKAAQMFIADPFKFSFVREFPDEDMDGY